MIDRNLPLYQNPQEVWDAKKCAQLAKHTRTDGLGTKYPFKGAIHLGGHNNELIVRYNGGCERDGRWWQGEEWKVPQVAPGYEIVRVPHWGWRIKRQD